MVLTESRTEALWVDDIRFEPVTVDQAKQDAVYAQIDSTIASLGRRLEGLKKTNNAYLRLGEPWRNGSSVSPRPAGRTGK